MSLKQPIRIVCVVVFTVLGFSFVGAGESRAQATRTWVSGIGDDANPCSQQAPCKTFAGAIAKTYISGEILALDPGGFGSVTITKSITIDSTTQFYFSPDGKTLTATNVTRTSEGSSSSTLIIWNPDGSINNLGSGESAASIQGKSPTLSMRIANWLVSRFGDDLTEQGSLTGQVEVSTASKMNGANIGQKRIFYAPLLNPTLVRKFRQPSSPSLESLPVGGVFVVWAGDGDNPTPISDKVTITVQEGYNEPIILQLKA